MENNNEKVILEVSENENRYRVQIPEGLSVPEALFAVSIVIRCLHRDGYLKTIDEGLDMVKRYCTDEQFTEVKEETENAESKEKA